MQATFGEREAQIRKVEGQAIYDAIIIIELLLPFRPRAPHLNFGFITLDTTVSFKIFAKVLINFFKIFTKLITKLNGRLYNSFKGGVIMATTSKLEKGEKPLPNGLYIRMVGSRTLHYMFGRSMEGFGLELVPFAGQFGYAEMVDYSFAILLAMDRTVLTGLHYSSLRFVVLSLLWTRILCLCC
ncbi:hypothetical protein ACJX0J_034901 [Zea mays]